METEAIIRKRALKAEIDKQKQRQRKTELAQIPIFTIGNPCKSSKIASRARESKKAAYTEQDEMLTSHSSSSRKQKIVTEDLKAHLHNNVSKIGVPSPDPKKEIPKHKQVN